MNIKLSERISVSLIRLCFSTAIVILTATGLCPKLTAADLAGGQIQPARRWDFNITGNLQGWKASSRVVPVVMGGALWIKLLPPITDPSQLITPGFQVHGPKIFGYKDQEYDIESPPDLGIPASAVKKVRMRILNLSPLTDAHVFWRTRGQLREFAGSARFTLKPDLKEWQEVVCHVDGRWEGTIDQIVIRLPFSIPRGDLWIDSLEITDGQARVLAPPPDLSSDRVVPRLRLPGITQADFQDAFKVLEENVVMDVPVCGFPYPFFRPGGRYGANWWQMDANLAVAGAKWVNQDIVEGTMRGFRVVQTNNPDGRINLHGSSAVSGQVADQSSIPVFFEAAYDVARRTGDVRLREEIYLTMSRYLDWWLSPVKRDPRTGLITGIFEETFGEPYLHSLTRLGAAAVLPQTIAGVDLNVAVAIGCHRTAEIARQLAAGSKQGDYQQQAERYNKAFEDLKQSINQHMWNEKDGAYYNVNVKEGVQRRRLICSTFEPMRLGIAPPERIARLSSKLIEPGLFNWNKLPVTSLAMTDKGYVEATGKYDGSVFFGDVTTFRNLPIIAGLEDSGRHDLASELAWMTIKAFNHNYWEYLVPSTGKGEGEDRFTFSASQYIQAIIEHLFGVDYDRMRGRLRIVPHVPVELEGQDLSLDALILPSGLANRLSLHIRREKGGETKVAIEIEGPLPQGHLEILIPQNGHRLQEVVDDQKHTLPLIRQVEGLEGVAGVRIPMQSSVRLIFR